MEKKSTSINKSFLPLIEKRDLRILRKIFINHFDTQEQIDKLDEFINKDFVNKEIKQLRSGKKVKFTQDQNNKLKSIFCAQILTDLLKNNWDISLGLNGFILNNAKSKKSSENLESQKKLIRDSHLNVRNLVIGNKENQKFIEKMETPKEFNGMKFSVLDLIDNGRDLLQAINDADKKGGTNEIYESVIKPEIIPVYGRDNKNEERRCSITGLYYTDIWRYFRYTWSTEFLQRPAREFPFIIRNAARPNKPVMGISMLSSTALGNEPRDYTIGWYSIDQIRTQVINGNVKIKEVTESLLKVIDDTINEIYKKDLKFLNKKAILNPTDEIIEQLEKIEGQAREDRAAKLTDEMSNLDSYGKSERLNEKNENYENIVLSPLIVRKRAASLARLLKVRKVFNQVDLKANPARAFAELTAKVKKEGHAVGFEYIKGGKNALQAALSELRLRRNNTNIMELSTCGSIAPYNYLLGGKLITLLMSSKEIHQHVAKRYNDSNVIIRSKLAGKKIKSDIDLKVITTTSLYGNSSQYNRLKIQKGFYLEKKQEDASLKFKNTIHWKEAKKENGQAYTGGIGTYHFSSKSAAIAQLITISQKKYREVNAVMGEGASPKLRLMREAIRFITPHAVKKEDIHPDDFLEHGAKRKNYIYFNDQNILSSLIKNKKTVMSNLNNVKLISTAWIHRWMGKGVKNKTKEINKFTSEEISSELKMHKNYNEKDVEQETDNQLSFIS